MAERGRSVLPNMPNAQTLRLIAKPHSDARSAQQRVQDLSRGRGKVPRQAHNLEVAGSTPARAAAPKKDPSAARASALHPADTMACTVASAGDGSRFFLPETTDRMRGALPTRAHLHRAAERNAGTEQGAETPAGVSVTALLLALIFFGLLCVVATVKTYDRFEAHTVPRSLK